MANIDRERAFLAIRRKTLSARAVAERVRDFRAVESRLPESDAVLQAARCMNCGTPFCHGFGCPLKNIVPELNTLVFREKWDAAAALLLAMNPFPEITGRICPALCETSCVLGAVLEPVAIRAIELEIIEKAYDCGYMKPRPPLVRRPERVAVIGSGPAGLAAAEALNRSGFHVTVYEDSAKAGGVLRYGIPEFKLEKWVLDRRLTLMRDEGIVFETGVEVGRDISLRFLRKHYQALILACGARQARDISVPGRNLAGIYFAMEYLAVQNRKLGGEEVKPDEEIMAAGKSVLVIGGGDTGADCVGTAIRQGAAEVAQWEIMPKPPEERPPDNPWPEWPRVLRTSCSHQEGGQRRWSTTVKEFIGRDGAVVGARGVEVEWRGAGQSPAPIEKPGSSFEVKADLVLLALGYTGPGPHPLAGELSLRTDARGFIARDCNHMTSEPGIFIAGDMSLGASLVVRAIADGLATAQGVAVWLEG